MSEQVERELAQALGFDIREGESISGHKYAVSGKNDRPCDAVEAYKLWRKCVELKLAQATQREATIRECAEIAKTYEAFLRQRAEQVANSTHAQHLAKQWRVAAVAVGSVACDILALLPKEDTNVQ